jgi:hypothetical protein
MSSRPLNCRWLAALVITGGQGARAPGACLIYLALSGRWAQLQLLCLGVLWLQAACVTVLSTVPCVPRLNIPCPCVPCPPCLERLNTELGSAQCSAGRFAACKCSTLKSCKGLFDPPMRHPCCCHAIPNSTASCGAACAPIPITHGVSRHLCVSDCCSQNGSAGPVCRASVLVFQSGHWYRFLQLVCVVACVGFD